MLVRRVKGDGCAPDDHVIEMSGMVSKSAGGANVLESTGYLDAGGERLYYVLHSAEKPVGLALLAGPFATQRPYSYAPWVRWARYLASHGVTAMRFDYSGVSESTGNFEEMTFSNWINDIERCAAWLSTRAPGLPLILHGLELGGLLASEVFRKNVGNGLLMWSPPKSGLELIQEVLVYRLAVDFSIARPEARKTWQDYRDDLESGLSVTVEGYPISGRLWRESNDLQLKFSGNEDNGNATTRPWKQVVLDPTMVPLVSGFSRRGALNPRVPGKRAPLNPDLSTLYSANLDWLLRAIKRMDGNA